MLQKSHAKKYSYFIFNGKLYMHVDRVSIGLPLALTLQMLLREFCYSIAHHQILSIIISAMLVIYLFHLPHQNICKLLKIFLVVTMVTCSFRWKITGK